MDPRIVATNGDEVVVQYVTRALAPDGERFESPVVALYAVRDGKFARAQMFHYDTAAILAFLERASNFAARAQASDRRLPPALPARPVASSRDTRSGDGTA
jgi:hypothetical protein